MRRFRNVVMVTGVLALWLVTLFFILVWPWFNDLAVILTDRYLAFLNDNLRQYLFLSIVHSIGALFVGGIIRLVVVSDRPMWWIFGSAVLMGLFALSQTLDFWFTQIGFVYQVAEITLALCPPIFCILGGVLASQAMTHFSKNNAL